MSHPAQNLIPDEPSVCYKYEKNKVITPSRDFQVIMVAGEDVYSTSVSPQL